ncbi:MAG: hypothetical protein OSB39_13100 [Opitutales bacterium]|nr:hypothetical protein [Opitutales bacterium]|tara:strand:- start:50 stop:667 length:618 start_codon:yes stop_codon:yes gene_type:complete
MPRRKKSSKASDNGLLAGGCFMVMLVVGVVFTLYLYAAAPPWMAELNRFFEGNEGRTYGVGPQPSDFKTTDDVVSMMIGLSIANACITAFLWFIGYKACKWMVTQPLKKTGSRSTTLARAGSWAFLIPISAPAGALGVFVSVILVSSGNAQDHPWVLLNLMSPVGTVAVLLLLFPKSRDMDEAFDVIAPDVPEEDQHSDEEEPGR